MRGVMTRTGIVVAKLACEGASSLKKTSATQQEANWAVPFWEFPLNQGVRPTTQTDVVLVKNFYWRTIKKSLKHHGVDRNNIDLRPVEMDKASSLWLPSWNIWRSWPQRVQTLLPSRTGVNMQITQRDPLKMLVHCTSAPHTARAKECTAGCFPLISALLLAIQPFHWSIEHAALS